MRRLRVYADTSVYGGCFDAEFQVESRAFFREVSAGRFVLLIAQITVRELAMAPHRVRSVLHELQPETMEFLPFSDEVRLLRDAYMEFGILAPASAGDAEHVASATVGEADLLVSWNFKHIVHFDKIAAFQAVNVLRGYKPVRIHSPREVIEV
ncbi:MAG: type II toxin-antitoxin system VapC family toxin [Planctomycetes bacterium]|nr:type II toxin-antitoxin system VapC family toxin [Planctomycetota bacterium]